MKVTESLQRQWTSQRSQLLEERTHTQSGQARSEDDVAIVDFEIEVMDRLLSLPIGAAFDVQQIQHEVANPPVTCAKCHEPIEWDVDREEWRDTAAWTDTCVTGGFHEGPTKNSNKPEEGHVTENINIDDLEKLVQDQIAKQLGGGGDLASALGALAGAQQPQSFEDALANLDPRDSEAALNMLDFLLTTGRLQRVGVLDGGQGYMFIYREPKGTTKPGYVPGGTQGDRIVDAAVDQARASGQKALKRGLCPHCFSAVRKTEAGAVELDDETGSEECTQSPDGKHDLA